VKRAVIITNPMAARVGRRQLATAWKRLERGGLEVEVRQTEAPGHGTALARQAIGDGAELLIAHGGDGTAMDVAAAIVGTDRLLGLLPAGTGNILAANLGIRRAPRAAADVILRGRQRVIDVGRLETTAGVRYFAVAAGAGFDAELMHRTTSPRKRAFGVGAYVATAVGLATGITRARVRLETDQGVHEAPAASVLVANCGGLIPFLPSLAPQIVPDDGMLDVLVLDAASLPGAARIAWRLMTRRHGPGFGITLLRARRVGLTADPELPVQADGEASGKTPLTVELVPNGLTVIAPRGV
jgi:YegS/Rv2252/BmrU family lipid kinase